MKFTERKAFILIDASKELEGCTITFIPSGFPGQWLKIFEDHTYLINVSYADEDENIILNETEAAAKQYEKLL